MLKKLALALLTPLLLFFGWPSAGFAPLLFIGFVPLLFVDHLLALSGMISGMRLQRLWLFGYSFAAFLLWNLLSLWWLAKWHWPAMLAAVLVNSLLMALVMPAFRFIKDKIGTKRGHIALPFLWISFESLHYLWDWGFPWLTLGNGFAANVEWVQWYEHVGVLGGSFWILAVNLILFTIVRSYYDNRKATPAILRFVFLLLLGIGLPILLSYQRYNNYEEKGTAAEVLVLQPNLDQQGLSVREQEEKIVRLARENLDDSVDFLLGPETMLPRPVYKDALTADRAVQELRDLAARYQDLHVITGARILQRYEGDYTSTAKKLPDGGYVDAYNSAIFTSAIGPVETYHKSKLIPGGEMPVFGQTDKAPETEGEPEKWGAALGTQAKREVFSTEDGFKIAPVIGREAHFGEYLTYFLRNGANLIFILTDDDQPVKMHGHLQKLHYARLRAIENRRSIARAANIGISCFINQRGDILQPLPYGKEGTIKERIYANEELSYYSQAGNLLSRLSYFMAGFLFLYALVYGYLRRKERWR